MTESTTAALAQGENVGPHRPEQLLPLVYNELRKLAAHRLRQERPGQTLQPTSLVHEAFVRLAGRNKATQWHNRGHFFAAAAEAMRRILIERARQRATEKLGREFRRIEFDELLIINDERSDDLLLLDEALGELEKHDARAAELVKLRYFAGLTHQEAAETLGITRRAADRLWALGRAWLYQYMSEE